MTESLHEPHRDMAAHLAYFHLAVYQQFSTVTFAVESDLLPFEERWTRLFSQAVVSSNEMCKRLQATRLTNNDDATVKGNPISDFDLKDAVMENNGLPPLFLRPFPQSFVT